MMMTTIVECFFVCQSVSLSVIYPSICPLTDRSICYSLVVCLLNHWLLERYFPFGTLYYVNSSSNYPSLLYSNSCISVPNIFDFIHNSIYRWQNSQYIYIYIYITILLVYLSTSSLLFTCLYLLLEQKKICSSVFLQFLIIICLFFFFVFFKM